MKTMGYAMLTLMSVEPADLDPARRRLRSSRRSRSVFAWVRQEIAV
jgi:hypothetical protein